MSTLTGKDRLMQGKIKSLSCVPAAPAFKVNNQWPEK